MKRLTFLEFVNELKREFPAKKPIYVRRVITPFDKDFTPKKRLYGYCVDKDDCFVVKINKNMSLSEQKDTLIHEWAHCLAGWENNKDPHSKEWGIAYAKIYRKMTGD
jgi:Zn-dependent peptidase ImmA (M78 family)